MIQFNWLIWKHYLIGHQFTTFLQHQMNFAEEISGKSSIHFGSHFLRPNNLYTIGTNSLMHSKHSKTYPKWITRFTLRSLYKNKEGHWMKKRLAKVWDFRTVPSKNYHTLKLWKLQNKQTFDVKRQWKNNVCIAIFHKNTSL